MCGHWSVTPTWDRGLALTLVYHTLDAPVHCEEQGWAHQAFCRHAHVMCMTMIVDGSDHTLDVGVAVGKEVADYGWQVSHMAKPHGFAGSRCKQHKHHRHHISHIFFGAG